MSRNIRVSFIFCALFTGKCLTIALIIFTTHNRCHNFNFLVIRCNHSPIFESNLDNTVISEDTKVGTIIGNLSGSDPEGSDVRYGIENTDFFSVDPISGAVKLEKPLNREVF